MSDLIKRYQYLSTRKSHLVEVKIEEEKKHILEQLLAQLAKEAPLPFHLVVVDEDRVDSQKNLRKYSYYVLLCFGVLEDVANSYFMGFALFILLFPNIATSALFIASIVYASIESALFYVFDGYELRLAMGIEDKKISLGELLKVYEQQVTLATMLNTHLGMMSTLEMSDKNYRAYISFLVLVNNDLEKKLHHMTQVHETAAHKIFRISVMLFGAISSLAGSYFMVTTLMALFCISMSSTPVGIAIILVTMMLGLAFHYFMDSTSLTRIVNPHYDKFQSMKEELLKFNKTYPQRGELLLQQRERYKPHRLNEDKSKDKDSKVVLAPVNSTVVSHSLFKPRRAMNSDNLNLNLEPVYKYK